MKSRRSAVSKTKKPRKHLAPSVRYKPSPYKLNRISKAWCLLKTND